MKWLKEAALHFHSLVGRFPPFMIFFLSLFLPPSTGCFSSPLYPYPPSPVFLPGPFSVRLFLIFAAQWLPLLGGRDSLQRQLIRYRYLIISPLCNLSMVNLRLNGYPQQLLKFIKEAKLLFSPPPPPAIDSANIDVYSLTIDY